MNSSDITLIEAIKVWIKDKFPDMQQTEVNILANHFFNITQKRMETLSE